MSRRRHAIAPQIAAERFRLDNGLRVVVSPDRSSPSVAVAVFYDVGFRSEPPGRTGFAHLFEHLMFQGSATLEKGQHFKLVQGAGGTFNGSTSNDYTNYYEEVPSEALELALFCEADRMRQVRLDPETLANQVAVVKEEIRVNVQNRPYGGFPWIHLPMTLFETFPNAHDGYGDFVDLESVTLEEAAAFFDRYYAPSNAVLAVSGDVDPDEARVLVERHFGAIPSRPAPPPIDASEPPPSAERRTVRVDAHAPQPAVAAGYRAPHPVDELDDYLAAVLLAAVLSDGDASRLQQRLVRRDRIANRVDASVGLSGGAFATRDPSMFEVVAFYAGPPSADAILGAVHEEVSRLADGLEAGELERFRNAWSASYLRRVDSLMARAHMLATFDLQRGHPGLLNELPERVAAVTPDAVSSVAGRYLTPDRRGVVEIHPAGRR